MLQDISDSELIFKTKALACEERRLLAQVLLHLEEIERRRLYLPRFTSLFDFCLEELGYSRNEAYARISAMRISREVPEVVQAVESGRLSLTNLTIAQSYFKQEKRAGKVVPSETKREVLRELEGLSTRECEKRLMPESLARKVFELDDALAADLKRIRELWGNQDLNDTELLRRMAKLVLSRIDPERIPSKSVARVDTKAQKSVGAPKLKLEAASESANNLPAVPAELVTPENRHIPAETRRAVWARDRGQCTHVHGGQRCSSRYALQYDHLLPYAYGGAHTADNLRLLCRAHHRALTERRPATARAEQDPRAG